jgi:hypothetical protein
MVRHDHSIEANRYGEHLPPRCFSSLRTGPGRDSHDTGFRGAKASRKFRTAMQ